MQNVLKCKNMQKYFVTLCKGIRPKRLTSFPIFSFSTKFFFFLNKHTFYTILHLLICISKKYFKKSIFFKSPLKTALRGGPQNVTEWSVTYRCFFTPSLSYYCFHIQVYPKYPFFLCNKTRYCIYIHRVKITVFFYIRYEVI